MGRVILIGGGSRSGKSRYALERARAVEGPRLFVATAREGDEEMRARIAAHRRERGEGFVTVEEPLDIAGCLREAPSETRAIVVDCLTLWLSNLLLAGTAEEASARIEEATGELVEALAETSAEVFLVTNEVGMGIVPGNELARRFRDHAGRLHQRLAGIADEIYLAAMGLLLRLHPGPVELVSR